MKDSLDGPGRAVPGEDLSCKYVQREEGISEPLHLRDGAADVLGMLRRPAIRGDGSCLRQGPNAIGLAPSAVAESRLVMGMCVLHSLIAHSICSPFQSLTDEVDVVECEGCIADLLSFSCAQAQFFNTVVR